MARASTIQDSFAGGEISPLSQGRVTIPRYKECLAICENYIPLLQGPITRRPGSEFVFPVKDQTAKTRLIPFVFSTSQSYMLEFGNQYIRVFKDGAILTSVSKNITGITQANPAVVTSNSHGYSNGDRIVVSGVLGMTELNNREFVVANVTTNTFQLTGENSTGYTAYASAGTASKIYEITSPYLTADLPAIQYVQSDDIIYLAHSSYQPQRVIRLAEASWVCTSFNNQDGPYYDVSGMDSINSITLTLTINNLTHVAIITLSDITGSLNNQTGFQSTDVGRVVRIFNGTDWFWSRINSVLDATDATVSINFFNYASKDPVTAVTNITNMAQSTAFSTFRWGLWSGYDGYPSTVVIHQDRVVFGGATLNPSRFDGSNASNYEIFSPTDAVGNVTAAHSYGFSVGGLDFNQTQWMTTDERGLLMGTSGAEWVVNGSDAGSALDALSVSASKTTSAGGANVQAVQLGKNSLFVQLGGNKVRELQPSIYTIYGFVANDLTQFAEHITQSGIVRLAAQKNPQTMAWALRADGVLTAMTYERDLEALKVGWSRHIMGGVSTSVEDVAVIPSSDGLSDQVYLIVKRTINGTTARYIEYLTPIFGSADTLSDAFQLDSGLSYSGSATTTISGINHLNGETLIALADGVEVTNLVPVNGRITLPVAASNVVVGYAFDSKGQKLRSDAGAADGSAIGKTRRTNRVGFHLLNTLGFKFGPDFGSLDEVTLDSSQAGTMADTSALFTGITTQLLSSGYDFDNMFCWQQSGPFPGTILGIFPDMETQDR